MDKFNIPYKDAFRSKTSEEHRLAAIMFTDIVAFTKIMGKNEQKALSLLEKNRKIQKTIIELHHGKILKEMGDGIMVSFNSSSESVVCAQEIIKAVQKESELSLRIGIHEGDIMYKDDDIFGDGVNIASRLQDEASENGIFISESVYIDIRNKPDINVEFVDEKSLKNIDHPIKIYSIIDGSSSDEASWDSIGKMNNPKVKSIIVLPFHNISSDENQEYFCDGLTEEIITDLSQIENYRVISRNSSMYFKGTKKKTKEIAKVVDAQYVLEGSIQKHGNNIRITSQLIDTSNDTLIWADKYNGTLDDVFDIQEKVSLSIVDELKTKLNVQEAGKLAERRLDNSEALECYFKAKREMGKMSEVGLSKSLDELQRGMNVVGDNALLYACIGLVYFYFYETGIDTNQKNLKLAQEYAHKVLKLDSGSSTGYFLLGAIEQLLGNSIKATQYLKQALKYDSCNLNALQYLSKMYSLQYGKPIHAESLVSKMLEIDPMSAVNYVLLGLIQWMENKIDFAISSFKKSNNLDPKLIYSKLWLMYGLAWKGLKEQAIEQINQVVDDQTDRRKDVIFINWCMFFKYALLGKKSKALEILDKETEDFFYNIPELLWFGICNFTLIDEIDEALKWLERAINWGWINYPFIAEEHPLLMKLRNEKRFQKLLGRVKEEWENCDV